MKFISSKDNPEFKTLKKLSSSRYRAQKKLFLAEGEKFLSYPEAIEQVILHQDYQKNLPLPGSLEPLVLTDSLFRQLSSQEHSQGVICLCRIHFTPADPDQEVTVIGDGLRDPGNLGTLIRTMDAAGYHQLILTSDSVDATNEKCVRASMGSIFHVNVVYMDYPQILNWTEKYAIPCYATSLDPCGSSYRRIDWQGRIALILGNESRGVSDNLLSASKARIHIPLYGFAESLNVSISAGILLYHIRGYREDGAGN